MSPSVQITGVSVHPYTLRFPGGVRTAAGRHHERAGTLLRLVDASGRVGWGDASPWPGRGPGGGARVARLASGLVGRSLDGVSALTAWLWEQLPAPGDGYGVELAVLDLMAQAQGLPLARLLGPGAPVPWVEINAVVADAEDALRQVSAGFTTLKLKVGAGSVAADVARLRRVRGAVGPDVTLRVDANGALDLDAAVALGAELTALGVSLFEQPVAGPDDMVRLRGRCGVPLGADELAAEWTDFPAQMAEVADVVVLKPMAQGGLLRCAALAREALAQGLDVVVTSSWESVVGRAGALHLAATLPRGRAHGLAHPFDQDVGVCFPIRGGRAGLPAAVGLGVCPSVSVGALAPTAAGRGGAHPTGVSADLPRTSPC